MLTKEENICLINFDISLAMDEEKESAVGISAGFLSLEQYRDSGIYANITHNYALQKSIRGAQNREDNKTEVFASLQEENRTEIMPLEPDYEEKI